MPIDRSVDYEVRLDRLEHAGRSHGRWGRRLVLVGAGSMVAWTLSLAVGVPLTLLGVSLALLLAARRAGRRPVGAPIPPKQMRRLLRRGRAYVSDEHAILAADGFYLYSPQTGHYELVPGAVDPLVAQQWVRQRRSAQFWDGMLQGAWLSFLWRH